MITRARVARVPLVVALGALLAPVAAQASSVQISSNQLIYFAVAGETNSVTVSEEAANFRVRDPGATITPLAPCVMVTAIEATCPAATVRGIALHLDDKDDTDTIDDSVRDLPGAFGLPIVIEGGPGDDHLNGATNVGTAMFGNNQGIDGPGADVLIGGARGDQLSGSGGNDVLQGGPGDDSLTGGTENDVMEGGEGGDSFIEDSVANGADAMSGGAGNDSVIYGARAAPVSVSGDDQANDGEAGEADNVGSDIETISGGSGDDVLTGGPGPNTLFGNDGADVVDGGAGRDSVSGGNGNDVVTGGPDDDRVSGDGGSDTADGGEGDDTLVASDSEPMPDTLNGGAGTDLADYGSDADPVTVSLDGVADDGLAGEGDNVMPDVEDVNGGGGADVLVGNASANALRGGSGADTLDGLDGADGLDGGAGDDTLDGGVDRDSLGGGGGADRLRTRDSGPDEVSCGGGPDVVIADLNDDPQADCELTSTGIVIGPGSVSVKKSGTGKLSLTCPAAEGISCAGKLTLARPNPAKRGARGARGSPLATAKFSIVGGATKRVRLKLTKAGVAALRRSGRIAATATAQMTDAAGAKVRTAKRVQLRSAGKR